MARGEEGRTDSKTHQGDAGFTSRRRHSTWKQSKHQEYLTVASTSPSKPPFIIQFPEHGALVKEMAAIGVSEAGIRIMGPKGNALAIKVPDLKAPQASILKQQMLSLGGDAAQSKNVLTDSTARTDVLLLGSEAHFRRLVDAIGRQQFGLSSLALQIEELLTNWRFEPSLFLAREKKLKLAGRTAIMGILNVTPDSFSDGGKFVDTKSAVERALQMQEQGADIIDIGAESTRPGAAPISIDEELQRLLPVLRAVAAELRAIVSADTYKSSVAEAALDCGADMINDVSGLTFDRNLAQVVARYRAGLAVMHIQGTPRNMQTAPHYDDLLGEVHFSLSQSCSIALDAGIGRQSIAVDPGIGFGKTLEHNLRLINYLGTLMGLGMPILLGTSRKSFIGKVLDKPVEHRMHGTAASVALAIARGANIVRVHDVLEMREVCDVVDAIVGS